MTENNIKLLGFEKQIEESHPSYYYYTLNLVDGLSFISSSDDEVGEDGEWFIEFFNTEPPIRYFDYGEAVGIIENIKRHIVK